VVAGCECEAARLEAPSAIETIGVDLSPSSSSQSLIANSQEGKEPIKHGLEENSSATV
jgi:hypothetical protein